MNILSFILIFIIIEAGLFYSAFVIYPNKKNRLPSYHIKIKHARGTHTKLILDKIEYEQFEAFMNGADGIYKIEDGKKAVTLERRYIAAVEMRAR